MKLLVMILLSITLWNDSVMLDAYRREDMSVWKAQLENRPATPDGVQILFYEYGYCGYIVAEAKKAGQESPLWEDAKQRVQRFKADVETFKGQLPAGHYEMYLSAVYVFELRLHESIHPVRSMNLAKEAVKIAPQDPLVLSYYGTCLFYAPKPFGSKEEALKWFEKAQPLFASKQYRYCWVREANEMYIRQCREKLKK